MQLSSENQNEDELPIINITDENLEQMWPALRSAIQKSSFVSLDLELSGLGDRKKLNYPEIDIRYKYTAEIAKNYSIVSLGLSCFSCESVQEIPLDGTQDFLRSQSYMVQTFNILTLKQSPFTVESGSLKFLLSHGFDFNHLYAHGVLYTDGISGEPSFNPSIRSILTLLLIYEKPIVTHNGFVDLVFLYQNFYTELPKNIEIFAADLCDMFVGGIFDTKYIIEYFYANMMPATYLLYIFKKLQIENQNRLKRGEFSVHLHFPPYPQSLKPLTRIKYQSVLEYQRNGINTEDVTPLCESYKFHGWCSNGQKCKSSHSVDRMVLELNPIVKKRKNKSLGVACSSVFDAIRYKSEETNSPRTQKGLRDSKGTVRHGKRVRSDTNSSGDSSLNGDSEVRSMEDDETIDSTVSTSRYPKSNGLSKKNDDNDVVLLSEDDDDEKHMESSQNDVTIEQEIENKVKIGDYNGSSLKLDNSNDSSVKTTNSSIKTTNASIKLPNSNVPSAEDSHSAGFDAFMTAFIFSCAISSHGKLKSPDNFVSSNSIGMEQFKNKVYLIGKEIPFLIRKGTYCNTSQQHDKLIRLIKGVNTI